MLGLSIDGDSVTASVATRSGDGAVMQQVHRWQMALDILSADPELVAQEIRDNLNKYGIRERRCVVCIPLKWVLTNSLDLPDLEGDDLDSYISVCAEREFPFAPEELVVATSRYGNGTDAQGALLAAVSSSHMHALEAICKAAQLRVVGMGVGVAEMIQSSRSAHSIALLIGDNGVDLGIFARNGFIALRSVLDSWGVDKGKSDFDVVARQLRISLSQIPEECLSADEPIDLYGPHELVAESLEALGESLNEQGMEGRLRRGTVVGMEDHAMANEDKAASPAAFVAAANKLLATESEVQFMPPRVHALAKFVNRVSARSTRWLGGAAAAALLIVGSLFFYQSNKLNRLEERWSEVAPSVEEGERLQSNLRTFRSWFDGTAEYLTIAKELTRAFPEDGSVWATSLSIVDGERVVCAAMAAEDEAWLAVHEALRNTPGVHDVQLTQVRGSSPLQFAISYRWAPGESNGL